MRTLTLTDEELQIVRLSLELVLNLKRYAPITQHLGIENGTDEQDEAFEDAAYSVLDAIVKGDSA